MEPIELHRGATEIASAAFPVWCSDRLERYAPLLDWLAG